MIIGAYTHMITLPRTVLECERIGANAFMCRTSNTRGVGGKPIEKYEVEEGHALMERIGKVHMVVHAPSSINLISGREKIVSLGKEMLYAEIMRGGFVGARHVVVHPGNNQHMSSEDNIKQLVTVITSPLIMSALEQYDMTVTFENMYGRTGDLGCTMEELAGILNAIPKEYQHRFGICIDLSHLWGMGYDVRYTEHIIGHIDNIIGWDRVHVVHVNGSAGVLGGHKDKCTNIGAGDWCVHGSDNIGGPYIYAFVHHPKVVNKILIVETPNLEELDLHKAEIEYLKTIYS